ncbi:MAG TPA: DUF5106 domain-containing protein [Bacteroidales bacterium]|nr:DUF5106 domain-containing protein [Bacteroidales bacterium]
MKRIKFILTIIFIGFISFTNAQGYKIEVQIKGIKDTTIMLGYHLGEKKYVQDTAKVDSKGYAVFQGDSLKQGIYLVILPSKTYFEILVTKNQKFGVKTDSKDLLANLTFTASRENTAFSEYQRFMVEQQKLMTQYQATYKAVSANPDSVKIMKDKEKDLDKKVNAYWADLIKNDPNSLLSAIVKTMIPIQMPEFKVPDNVKNADSLKWVMGYQYNKNHYFDNISLTDSRLIRTPILEQRLNTFFDRLLIPVPDSITPEAIKIIEKTRLNKEMFQYVLSHLGNKFSTSNVMGLDAVFVAIAEKYYLTGQAWWADKKMLEKIQERVNALKPNLIGNQCPELSLPDMAGRTRKLSDINAKITVLYFFDSNCSHCKKVTPEVKKLYDIFKPKGLEVYAVYTQGNQPELVEYINKNNLNWINVWDPAQNSKFRDLFDIYSTPVIYVLDAKKKIIAKRISEESLKQMLEQEFK